MIQVLKEQIDVLFYHLKMTHKRYYLPTAEIKNYVVIDGQNFFDQPARNNLRTYDSIQKIATGQGDVYTTSSLLDYNYFKNYYELIAIALSKQQALDVPNRFYWKSNSARKCNNVFHY